MPVTTKQDEPVWKNPLLWLVIGVVVLVAVRLLPLASDDPRDATAVDRTFHIGLSELPQGWRVQWSAGTESSRRLALDSPDGTAQLLVFAFKGELDHRKFADIGELLYGQGFPKPRQTNRTPAYGSIVTRSLYVEPGRAGRRPIDTEIDVLWHEAEMNQDYAFVVVARSLSGTGVDIEIPRAALQFTPPRLTGKGQVSRWITKGFDFVETGEGLLGLFTWGAAAIWGVSYLWRQLGIRWKWGRLAILALLVGLVLLGQRSFHWSVLQTSLAATAGVFVSGFATALLTRAWRFEDE